MDKLIASHSRLGSRNLFLRIYLSQAAMLARRRSFYYSNPEYLEEAIRRTSAHLGVVSLEDPERDEIVESLAELVRNRARDFGDAGVPETDPNDGVVEILSTFWGLAAFLAKRSTDKLPSMTQEAFGRHVDAVTSTGRITDKAEIHKAVQYCQLLRPSIRRSPNQFTNLILFKLGAFLGHAFQLTIEPAYLNESIDILQSIIEERSARWMNVPVIERLLYFLTKRLEQSEDRNHLDQMFQLFLIISMILMQTRPTGLRPYPV